MNSDCLLLLLHLNLILLVPTYAWLFFECQPSYMEILKIV